MQNILAEGRLKPSSNDAMVNSLTDGSTETFWESRDEPRSKTKALMVTFNDDKKLYAAAIHNDNGKDAGVCMYVHNAVLIKEHQHCTVHGITFQNIFIVYM